MRAVSAACTWYRQVRTGRFKALAELESRDGGKGRLGRLLYRQITRGYRDRAAATSSTHPRAHRPLFPTGCADTSTRTCSRSCLTWRSTAPTPWPAASMHAPRLPPSRCTAACVQCPSAVLLDGARSAPQHALLPGAAAVLLAVEEAPSIAAASRWPSLRGCRTMSPAHA